MRLKAAVGPFVPVEERVPQWSSARSHIQSMLPRHLRVVPRDKESLRLDTQFCGDLLAIAPPDARGALYEMFDGVGCALAEYFGPIVRDAVGRQLCPHLVAEINDMFVEADYWNIAAGRPTARDYILHCFGVAPIHTPPDDEETQQDHTEEVR